MKGKEGRNRRRKEGRNGGRKEGETILKQKERARSKKQKNKLIKGGRKALKY
jgi:hypothetical protein